PLSLESIGDAKESVIYWNSTEPDDTNIKVYTAVTDSAETVPGNWTEASSGEPIPGIGEEDDLRGKYLWTKQLFLVNESNTPPRLHSVSEAVVETPRTDFDVQNLSVQPDEVYGAEETEFKVHVENQGYASGNHTVEFYVEDDLVGSDTVTVESGGVETASMIYCEEEPGTYQVEVDGLSTEFTVYDFPDVEAMYADELTVNSAELHGELTNIGLEEEVESYFRYRVKGEEWSETPSQTLVEETEFHESVELQEKRTYEFKAVVEWDDQEVISEPLNFSTSSHFEVDILDHDEFVYAGETASLKWSVSNTESARDAQEIIFEVRDDGEVVFQDSENLELGEDEEYQGEFTWDTAGVEVDVYDLVLKSEDDEEEAEVELMGEDEDMSTLEIEIEGEGTTEPGPGTHEYQKGEEIIVEAIPEEDWEFSHWSGDVSEEQEGAELTVVMDENRTLTAHFERIDHDVEYELTIEVEGRGATNVGEGTVRYNEGQLIPLKAFPEEGWKFSHWSGDVPEDQREEIELTIKMDSNRTITAHFVKGADFTVEIISPEDGDEFEKGEEITVEYEVRNTGGSVGEQAIEFRVDGKLVETEEGVVLGPEDIYEKNFTWEADSEGEVELVVRCVDNEKSGESTAEVTISVTEERQISYWWILVVLLVGVLIAALVLAKRKERDEEDEDEEEEEMEDEELSEGSSSFSEDSSESEESEEEFLGEEGSEQDNESEFEDS
ncbi:MAG: CARDB domain-containing protein, partial [Candidatus Thermoplasmatota archaeon]